MGIIINDLNYMLEAYREVWFTNCNARYRLAKGGRSTGKSEDFIGIEPIFKILSNPKRNIMFIRQNYKDNSQSTFTLIKKWIYQLHLQNFFRIKVSPYEIILKKTGQKMIFGGMNDVENVTSTAFETGYWTDTYFEEASQLKSYEEFRVVDGSMRIPNTETELKCQITFLFNAWDVGHWLYEVFYKGNLEDNVVELEDKGYQYKYIPDFNLGQDSSGLALHISSYKVNKYNTIEKVKNILELKNKSYDIYLCEGLGCWGNTRDQVYPEWSDYLIKHQQETNKAEYSAFAIGIDFGLSNGEGKVLKGEDVKIGSATSMILCGISKNYEKLTFLDEYYWSNETSSVKKTGPAIQDELITTLVNWLDKYLDNYTLMKGRIAIYVDSADAGGFRDGLTLEAHKRGYYNFIFMPSTKIKIQSRVDFMRRLMAFGDVEFSDACPNLIRETKNAKRGQKGECREDTNDHALTASEYGWIPLKERLKRWKTFKSRD